MPTIASVPTTVPRHRVIWPADWIAAVWVAASSSASLWSFDILCLPRFYEVGQHWYASVLEHADRER